MSQTRIKICGVTRPEDAVLAVELGAHFIGLNFYRSSPRYVEVARAQEIARSVQGRSKLVGVFVNSPPSLVERTVSEVGLDLLQFHGDESVSELARFGTKAIKVLRLEGPPTPSLLEAWPGVWGFLIEGHQQEVYGGSGRAWAYEMIGNLSRTRPVFVAGGLSPDNVGEAVRLSGAWGVDVCSGVEASPGVKSKSLMEAFFREVEKSNG